MVEQETRQRSSSEKNFDLDRARKFKFCYIIRGLPGSGKSTVAAQLAGDSGVILHLDGTVRRSSQVANAQGIGGHEADNANEIKEKHYAEFCTEVRKGTPIIVVDNSNILESEYLHFIEFA